MQRPFTRTVPFHQGGVKKRNQNQFRLFLGFTLGEGRLTPLPNQSEIPRGTPVEDAPPGGDWQGLIRGETQGQPGEWSVWEQTWTQAHRPQSPSGILAFRDEADCGWSTPLADWLKKWP